MEVSGGGPLRSTMQPEVGRKFSVILSMLKVLCYLLIKFAIYQLTTI